MRQALGQFLQEVRAAGVPVSLAESMDALRAAMAAGVEREVLREALAAALVKEEADRAAFDEVFERFFSSGAGERRRRSGIRGRAGESGGGGATGGGGQGASAGRAERAGETQGRDTPAGRPEDRRAPERKSEGRPAPLGRSAGPPERPQSSAAGEAEKRRQEAERRRDGSARSPEVVRRGRRRELLGKPFRDLDPAEGEELVALAAELARRFRARFARRFRRGRRGRLDFRRTLRRSVPHGGAAFDLAFRRRRPGRPDLLALCDLSGSVRHAAELFAALLEPCRGFFRRVRLVVYVDRPVEASVENGRLVPHAAVDFHAFSDLGRVLVEVEEAWAPTITRSTVLLVLGDARNNRRPARADVLGRLRARSRTLWWLIPEARGRWGTGDSALESYRPFCDQLLECSSGAELLAAMARLAP